MGSGTRPVQTQLFLRGRSLLRLLKVRRGRGRTAGRPSSALATSFIEVKRKELAEPPKGKKREGGGQQECQAQPCHLLHWGQEEVAG